MNGVTPEEIEKAREMDLLTYLRTYEPYELVRVSGSTYSTKTHDSLKISNGLWMWFSRGFGGKSALDYLIRVKGYSFVDAVKTINQQEVIRKPSVFYCPKPEEKELLLPEKNTDSNVITRYLYDRGIDLGIIRHCLKEGLIYEALPYHNVIFLGFDKEKIPRYAAYRATNGTRILGDASGSDKRYCFNMMSGKSNSIHIFESAIDLLSYATILKRNGTDWTKENLLSLAGVYGVKLDGTSKVPVALQRNLIDDEKINKVYLHFDNDRAGRKSTEGITNALSKNYEVHDEPPPNGKDYNDYLCSLLSEKSVKKTERKQEYER